MSYISKNEITYKDELTGKRGVIAPNRELTKDEIKALGEKTIADLLTSKAIKEKPAEKLVKAETKPKTEVTKGDGK